MIESMHGEFELVKNYREAFIMDDFNKRYVEFFDIFPYLVGDYSAGMLRLKGFKDENYHLIPDYIVESCSPNCAYYILKNPNYDKSKKFEE
ncbi:MAG: DUF1027 domain-containing protein [Candidatus Izemoplasmatales bacterium]|jgi:uncharacterized protein YutD|nr:DUF1027 domain-containing protein [Candidatus Izemoplasmatales bacterium]HPD99900.1 DUF1027 domain-containing protein [Bacillota bacterium]